MLNISPAAHHVVATSTPAQRVTQLTNAQNDRQLLQQRMLELQQSSAIANAMFNKVSQTLRNIGNSPLR